MDDKNSLLNQFNQTAKKSNLEYLLIGGLAASYWGEPRFTADLDFAVSSSSWSLVKIVLASMDYRLEFLHPKKNFAHFTSVIPDQARIDFMLVEQDTWDGLNKESKEIELGTEEKIPIVSPFHLIAMKLHAAAQPDRSERIKDLNDIFQIMLTQNISFEELEQKSFFEKYTSDSIVEKLKEIIKENEK